MKLADKLKDIQKLFSEQNLDGWLLYDFRRANDLACAFLKISKDVILTRRFFYWIPRSGEPVKIVNVIEQHNLDHLPGNVISYQTWKDLENALESILKGKKRVAMEYSPRNAIPAVSKVDAGTVELVRSFGVEVVSSADIMQRYTSVWDDHKLKTHLAAAEVLSETVDKAWRFIADVLQNKKGITEYDVQQFILAEFARKGCLSADSPLCSVNAHSADPHYCADAKNAARICMGDFILIDLWCKQDVPRAVYADITRVGVAAKSPTAKQQKVFDIVRQAQQAGTDLVKDRFARKQPLMGCEIDQCVRKVIVEAGYGEYFLHRTGHNIDENDHGNGTHLDSLETNDCRLILPGTCFSIEPGIYLPGEFGIRLEYDVYVHHDGSVRVTGGHQDGLTCLGKY